MAIQSMKFVNELPPPEGFIYLASPYSGNNFEQELRYQHALYTVYYLSTHAFPIYSPIVHYHEAAKLYEMPKDSYHWALINSIMLGAAGEVWVLMLNGWEQSVGVESERNLAINLGKPVRYIYYPSGNYDSLMVMEDN